MSKVYNCFPFFNELDILDIKMSQEYEAVDFFVISESTTDFMGRPKPLFFLENSQRYERYRDKIIHCIVDDMPDHHDPFEREYHQRHSLLKVAAQAADDDVFIISDADEILRASSIERVRGLQGIAIFDMPMFQFYMNLRQAPDGWRAAYAVTNRFLGRIDHIAQFRWDRSGLDTVLAGEGEQFILPDAGWHFTHLGGVEALKHKLASYSHARDAWPRLMKEGDNLQKHIMAGGIVGNLKERSEYIPISYPYFPLHINDNQTFYQHKNFIKDPYAALRDLQALYKATLDEICLSMADRTDGVDVLYGLPPHEYAKLSGMIP
ncbi:glycosyltransferase family 17 protein [Acetobacter vaccinii]|uniref:N-acetylglucosaminyltransferase n=1 Tax=Acetobacter vaccinii TaxID=2592655 RepID=A0A5C1YPT5_9PROT|nr:hypothetical protein [Acetobacter vaccinii]QEO17047.1 hypothetical protein FLP30_04235 [Acetobacter vaccinii]